MFLRVSLMKSCPVHSTSTCPDRNQRSSMDLSVFSRTIKSCQGNTWNGSARSRSFHRVRTTSTWPATQRQVSKNVSGQARQVVIGNIFTGTTWTQELVWCVVNNYDYKKAKEEILDNRAPFLEFTCISGKEIMYANYVDTVEQVQELASPRVIKTHLSWEMLPNSVINNNIKVLLTYPCK